MAAKLKIGGAWSGVLDAELEAWTVAMLREEIARRLGCGTDSINLICAGRLLKDGDGTQKLIELGVKNNAKILATKVSLDHGKELIAEEEKTDRLQRLRAAATSLAERHSDGSLPIEDFNMELENQSGEKVRLGTQNDQRALMMGLMFHAKGKGLVKNKKYVDALEVLAMGEEAFSLCDSKILELTDNFPILQIDMVWCYFMLKDISKLQVAGRRLQEAREGIERSHGKESTRLRFLQGDRHLELSLHLRLELLEGVVAYHSGDFVKAKNSLCGARAKYMQLEVPDEKLSQLMAMGYGESSAKRALRLNQQDVTRAVDFLIEEKVKKQMETEENIRRRNEIMEQRSYGVTPLKKAVDLVALKALVSIGFEKELAAESLRRNENDTQRALDDLTNIDTNSEIQRCLESRKKKRLRRAADATINELTSMGFPRETVVDAVRAYGTKELALNHLLEQGASNSNAQPAATTPVNDGMASSSNVGGGPAVGETIPAPSAEADDVDLLMANGEVERDVEMEDELTNDLQKEDTFADYDIELTREGEAIEEYLTLLLLQSDRKH